VSCVDLMSVQIGARTNLNTQFVVPDPAVIGCVGRGESIDLFLNQPIADRIATVVSADSVLRSADGTVSAVPKAAAKHDVALILSWSQGRAYVAETGEALGTMPPATFSTSQEGTLHGKVIEIAASLGTASQSASLPPESETKLLWEATDARYASLQ